MAIHRKVISSAALLLALSGCATMGAKVPLGGRVIEVKRLSSEKPSKLKGELLAVGSERLWLLAPDGVRDIRLQEIEQVRVRLHGLDGKKAGLWTVVGALVTGAALTVACSMVEDTHCAPALGVTALAWGLIGGPSALGLEKSSRVLVRGPDFEALRPYARFPQGLPDDLDLALLAPKTRTSERR